MPKKHSSTKKDRKIRRKEKRLALIADLAAAITRRKLQLEKSKSRRKAQDSSGSHAPQTPAVDVIMASPTDSAAHKDLSPVPTTTAPLSPRANAIAAQSLLDPALLAELKNRLAQLHLEQEENAWEAPEVAMQPG
ncbi:hypothetical protein CPB83DRAFT_841361 [Crepidotus variabilis]|uniref:Uncharacterized protein n=1 Tax=Crepidotus variabilis TaxID=179855 RepID=A0A9P6BDZ0_9AGAR|nr:hypothetical protein CPB83DRAFT_841361 [Crepidotus variabilis]